MSERNTLAGGPSAALIRNVRRVLRLYCGCRPERQSRLWLLTWEWAAAIRDRHESTHALCGYRPRRRPWPTASEIATQYLVLSLTSMAESRALRLPHHAQSCMPGAVQAHLRPETAGHDLVAMWS